jgi:preprotein translocase subunit SecA
MSLAVSATRLGALTGSCGRCARQGDPAVRASSFHWKMISCACLAATHRQHHGKLGMKEGEELEHPLLNRSIETAQRRVEGTTSPSANARLSLTM